MRAKMIWGIKNFIPMFLFPVADFYLFEWYIHDPWEDIKLPIQFLNIYFFELAMLALFFITGRLKWALRSQSIFFMAVGLADHYVLRFRSAPIMPWDIYSVRTALSVADNFSYALDRQTVLVIAGFLALTAAASVTDLALTGKKRMLPMRAAGTVIAVALLCRFTQTLHQDSTILRYRMYDKLFTPTVMSKRNGTAVAFLMELRYISVDKPAGYSAGAAAQILEPYQEEMSEAAPPGSAPNIIVIMNEAFSDPAILGDFPVNEDPMPFVHSISEGSVPNTISGYLNVSVLGGNTANTEFEFLTGNSMAFLPQGSVPYQQYLKRELPSLASHLRSLGYETVAAHPYNSTGWDRNKVYPLLGFDRMYFIRDYSAPEKIRKYVSDKACYDRLIELYEHRTTDKPLFFFNVTMQNHSSYTDEYDNFRPDIEVEGISSKALDNYLSLMKISDKAIRDLIGYFSSVDEDTVIVFFGDHQPTDSVVSAIWKLNGKDKNGLSAEETADRYKVPYFIWCNYDIGTTTGVETSTNFLATDVLRAAGIPLTGYWAYLDDLSGQFPVITSIRAVDKDGSSMDIKDAAGALNDYAILQYDFLFGK